MTATPTTHPDVTGVLDGIRATIGQATDHVDEVISRVETVLGQLPASETGGARADLAELRQAFAEAVDWLDDLLLTAGDTTALRRVGAVWVNRIGATASGLAGVASVNITRVDDHWTGVAADAYRNTLPAQQAALAALAFTSGEVDATLNDLASAIVRFWVSIGTACLGLVVALAGALGPAASVVGAPVATGMAIAGVGAMVTAANAALTILTDVTTATAERSAALERRLATDTAFPLGAWPRSTTDVSTDASITDGDGTDWHLR
jgi:hypothetical protein